MAQAERLNSLNSYSLKNNLIIRRYLHHVKIC